MNDGALRKALGYRRFGGPPRLLVFDGGYYVTRDVIEAGEELGWAVRTVPAALGGRGEERFVADLLMALCAHRPDFVLTLNHAGFDEQGVLAGLLARYEVPVASWFVDHPLPILGGAGGNATAFCQVFCIERTALGWLARQGYRDPVYLPTAAGRAFAADRIDRGLAEALAAPVCLVGDSWWRKGWEEPPPRVRAAAEELRRAHRLDKALVAAPADLEGVLAGLAEAGQGRAGQGGQGGTLDGPRWRYDVALAALAQAASEDRVALGRALQPLGLRVHGDAHWARLVPGVDLRPPLDPRSGTPAAFAGAGINVNVTAVHMPTAVNQRVWEVPAAGGFLLTDAQEDALDHFREGEEIVVHSGPEEAAGLARHFLAHPAEGRAVAERARARVEAGHRYPHRLQRMFGVMRARFG